MQNPTDNHVSAETRSSVIEVNIENAYDASEYANLENYLSKLPGVQRVHLDRTRGVAHLTYDLSVTTAEAIEADLNGCGYQCDCQRRASSKCQPGHPPVGSGDEARAVRVEAKSLETGTHAQVTHGQVAHVMERPRTSETAHAEMKDDEHAGHGAEMVRDLLRRFIVSIILSIPIVLFSPIGKILGLSGMPPFSIPMDLFGFLLATPVVWWGGWPFISAAWRALRRGEVNMMTLIALGILVSYTYSVVATFLFKGEVFYEAAAMLHSVLLVTGWRCAAGSLLERRSKHY